jgi:glycosyltransferase involved in cell wall biosynthesis
MRIHHVLPHFYPEKGGAESNLSGLARYLAGRGHEVVVHTSRRTIQGGLLPERDELDGVQIRRYRPSLRLGYYATLFRPAVRDADVLHLHGYGFLTNDRVVRTARGSIPAVYSLLHGVAQPPPTATARAKRAVYDRVVGLRTLRQAEAIVPTSEADRPWLEARRLPRERIHVLPAGIDLDAFQPGSPEKIRDRFGLATYVLFLGRLHREKSPDHLLRAIASLGSAWSGEVVFAGPDGGERVSLERLARSLGLGDRVVFAGEVDETTKRDLLSGALCLVLPSFYEAQGIVIAEAWAQGRPVIASRVGGIPYMVNDGRDGLLYPYGDLALLAACLRQIADNPSVALEMGRAGRDRARSLTWEAIAPRYEELYESLVGQPTRD